MFSPMSKTDNVDFISPTVGFLSLWSLAPSARKAHRYLNVRHEKGCRCSGDAVYRRVLGSFPRCHIIRGARWNARHLNHQRSRHALSAADSHDPGETDLRADLRLPGRRRSRDEYPGRKGLSRPAHRRVEVV